MKLSATECAWFSAFFEKALVSRVSSNASRPPDFKLTHYRRAVTVWAGAASPLSCLMGPDLDANFRACATAHAPLA